MANFAHWYQSGGVFMHLILLAGFAGALLGLLSPLLRKAPLSIAACAVGLLCVGVGAFAYSLGMSEVERALAEAPADMIAEARARGTALAKIPLTWGGLWSLPAFAGGVLGLVLGSRPRR